MNDIAGKLATMWSELLGSAVAAPDSDFFEDGGTSITAVHLAAMIQENLGVSFDAIDVVKLRTFGKVSELVGERINIPAVPPGKGGPGRDI